MFTATTENYTQVFYCVCTNENFLNYGAVTGSNNQRLERNILGIKKYKRYKRNLAMLSYCEPMARILEASILQEHQKPEKHKRLWLY